MYPQLAIAHYGQYLAALYAASFLNPASYLFGVYPWWPARSPSQPEQQVQPAPRPPVPAAKAACLASASRRSADLPRHRPDASRRPVPARRAPAATPSTP
jgi:hypothetical protein